MLVGMSFTTQAQQVTVSPLPQEITWGAKAFDAGFSYTLSGAEDADAEALRVLKAKVPQGSGAAVNIVIGERGDAAVAAYRKCAEIDPNYAYGYIGEGIHYYELAVDIQNKAAEELDDAKYAALMGEFETTLKACLPPFEKAFELSTDPELKASIAEYLKNACFRFRTEGPEYQEMYDKYANYNPAAE